MRPRRPRLDPSLYIGLRRYFLTFCCARRHPWFASKDVVALASQQIFNTAQRFDVAVIAYCFMPDHAHLLIEACTDAADAARFVHQAKQRSGFACAQIWGGPLWQPSYYDRILRDEDATLAVARYIVENPVRAGLVASPRDYPFSGSTRFTFDQILDAITWQP